ncbi:MAG TPA: hypothetical protein ENI98_10025 [Gammaproteobacteria bacterium]|nr:hypothetical protein [Gammaproteobacteria bacterium]
MKIDLELSDSKALALAQFVKRIGFQEMRDNAQDDKEAYEIRDAITTLQNALNNAGYSPR